jgi:radical SAM protein with 4Fe4S-binding SPASM domain
MTDALYYKIVMEASQLDPPLLSYSPFGTGEPLMDRKIVPRIKLAREYLSDSTEIHLYTNGSFLSDSFLEAVADIPMFALVVSINAASRETRKRLMGLNDYDLVVKYVRKAVDMGINTVASVVEYELSVEEMYAFDQMWRDIRHFNLQALNWSGNIYEADPVPGACYRALHHMTIQWNGRVNLCCMDLPARLRFGDINNQTIEEVWNSDLRQLYCKAHIEKKGHLLEVCKDCNHPRM